MKRYKMSKKASKSTFRKTSGPRSVNPRNNTPSTAALMRGGIRL